MIIQLGVIKIYSIGKNQNNKFPPKIPMQEFTCERNRSFDVTVEPDDHNPEIMFLSHHSVVTEASSIKTVS